MPDRAEPAAVQTYVARQPILNIRQEAWAYELLFRSGWVNAIGTVDLDLASASVIAGRAMAFDLSSLTAGRPALLNVTREVLVRGLVRMLPPASTWVELLETIQVDAEVLAACAELRREGYHIALDDFVDGEGQRALLDHADMVKVDWLSTPAEERKALPRRLEGRRIRLLAEKVETNEHFEEARRLGYTLFQGYFFCRPEILSVRDVPPVKLSLLRILAQVHSPDIDLDGLEAAIKQDLALCYKLLRYINSAQHGLAQPVDSVRQALILLGERQIRRWVTVLAITTIGEDRPGELLRLALIRARFCETLAEPFGLRQHSDDLFLLGLFSVLDALLGRPMDELLATLPIDEEIKRGLSEKTGPLAPVYDFCQAYERGRWDPVEDAAVDEGRIAQRYIEALNWGTASAESVPTSAPRH